MFRRKKVLITGGAGFVGANLVRRLIKVTTSVHLLIKKQTNIWRINSIKDKLNLHQSDLTNKAEIERIIQTIKPDIIFHLAAHGCYPQQKNLSAMINTNIIGTANLLQATASLNYQAFINTGTSSEYGLKKRPMRETDMLEPISFYAATKASATLLSQVFARQFNKPVVTLRLFSVYGPWEKPSRLIPTAIKAFLNSKILKLTSGNERHDFIFIDDVIDGLLQAAAFSRKLKGEIINLGTGKQYTNLQIVKLIAEITKKKVILQKGSYPARNWDTDCWLADVTKAVKLLNWRPKYSLKKGLINTIDWIKNTL